MSPDDPPKKPPRASWEPPGPDEKAAETPPPKKQRAKTPPPRASWETPAEGTPVVTAPAKPPARQKPATTPPATPPPPAPTAPTRAPASWGTTPPAPASGTPSWDATPTGWDAPSAVGWESSPSAGAPLATDLPAPPSASVVVEPPMTSASMISPAPPASSMVDDPRLPTLPPPPIVAEAPKRKKSPPPERFDDAEFDGDDTPERKRSSKVVLVAATTIVLGLGIATLVFLGNANKQRYLIACESQQVVAKHGRGFPPWGERNIDEGMWKPIKIPPEAECTPRETDDEHELSRWYLTILVDRASTALTAKEGATHGSKEVDEAFAMLEQALLHTRATDRREQRRDIERLLGDVGYWRATGKLKDAANALAEAAKQFDSAAAQRPRHVSDASAWATYVRKLVEDLKAGPSGAATTFPPTPPDPDRRPAPPGVALPVEPPKAGSGSADPITPIDAGIPTGGVLL